METGVTVMCREKQDNIEMNDSFLVFAALMQNQSGRLTTSGGSDPQLQAIQSILS